MAKTKTGAVAGGTGVAVGTAYVLGAIVSAYTFRSGPAQALLWPIAFLFPVTK